MSAGKITNKGVFPSEVNVAVKCMESSTFYCLIAVKCVLSRKGKTALECRDTSTIVSC